MNPARRTTTSNEARLQILLAQHVHLRLTISAAQRAAREVLETSGSARLEKAVARLQAELQVHLADEERLLEPIIATIDAWGGVRLELLRAEHAHQRAVLAVLAGRAAAPATTLVAERTLSLCADLLLDMDSEERELLNQSVLRDDLVLLDASDC